MIVTVLIVVIVICILVGGFCSGAETAFVSADPLLLENKAEQGNTRARAALNLLEKPSKLLSTTLVGTNLSLVTATSLATVVAGNYLPENMQSLITTVIMTPVILIFAELVPKSIGRGNSQFYTLTAAPSLVVIQNFLTPVITVVSALSTGALRLFGIREQKQKVSVTQEEVQILTDISVEDGLIGENEHTMIRRVFELNKTTLSSVMVPLVDLQCVPVESTINEALAYAEESHHLFFPVYEDRADNIIGLVSIVDMLYAAADLQQTKLDEPLGNLVNRSVPFIPETRPAGSMFREFQSKIFPVVFVVDEYGGVTGMITIQDLAEEIVGDLALEHPEDKPWLIEHAGGIDCEGRVDVDVLSETLGVSFDKEGYETVAGLILKLAGRIPTNNESFQYKDLCFTVIKATPKRIIRVRITKSEATMLPLVE